MIKSYPVYLVLHNIRSAENVGSIFRTADALAISHIYLTGYTPTPLDRFGRPVSRISKTALGAEKNITWTKYENINYLFKKLKAEKTSLVAVEQDKNSDDYKKYKPKSPTAFVFGNEVRGLSRGVLDNCDQILEIPMRGNKESLNVSVSVGVVLFRILNI